jgi:uncharacterized membrane protein
MKVTTKNIALLGMGIALYFVLGMAVKIPLIGHIQTDLGYIAFGCFLYILGPIACIVGVVGCLLESLLVSGWVPIGWMLGQLFIGLLCGIVYKKHMKHQGLVNLVVTILAVFIGVGLIKTVVECGLYSIPFPVKFAKNMIATVADIPPMIIGLFLGCRLNNTVNKE